MGAPPPMAQLEAAEKPAVKNTMPPALRLLQHEADIRSQGNEVALAFHLVNRCGDLVPLGQTVMLQRQGALSSLRATAISSLPDVDRTAPLIQALEHLVNQLDQAAGPERPLLQTASLDQAELGRQLGEQDTTPFAQAIWMPLKDREGRVDAGVLFCRACAFSQGELTLLKRLTDTYAHAGAALPVERRFARLSPITRKRAMIGLLASVGICCIPVRLNVMAPCEVIAAEAFVLTAPISGVVKRILVAPNSAVNEGQPLLQFEDIQARNDMILAQQKLVVAQARDTRTAASAFKDATAAHEITTAQAELELARLSHAYAKEVMERSTVTTPTSGVVIYTDRRDWEGRPVQVGEEILQVADPRRVAYRIDLPTGNTIPLQPGGAVSIHLDRAPLGGLSAVLNSISYSPRALPGGQSAYTVIAKPTEGEAPPRIGTRGTAQLYGERVPLIVQVLKRPLASARQFIGI
jgi:biotin carboxyl carrier protein